MESGNRFVFQVNEAPPLEGKKLLRYVQRCVEAAQENKYTIENAFDVHVIDYMVALARKEPDGKFRAETSCLQSFRA